MGNGNTTSIYFIGKENASITLIDSKHLLEEKKFIIPIYQRPYAWNADHFADLLNTLAENKEQDNGQRPAFLGTIIVAESRDISHPYIIIDGQQRITSLLLLLRLLLKKLEKLNIEYNEKESDLENNLEDITTYKEQIKQIISKQKDNQKNIDDLKKILILNRIYRENGELPQQEDLQNLKNERSILRYIDHNTPMESDHIEGTFKEVSEQFERHDMSKEPTKSLNYILKFCQFCLLLVQGDNAEDYAIDIFNSLNSTGEPLTAFEILKSLITKKDRKNAETLNKIEIELNKKNMKKIKQNKYTDRLLLFLNFMTEGLKQDNFSTFRDKKQILDCIRDKDKFDKAKIKTFIESTYALHSFILKEWETKEDSQLFKNDDAKICFDFLISMQHDRPLPILYHFNKKNIQQHNDDVVKACVAFTCLWRAIAPGGGTDRIDYEYAQIIKDLSAPDFNLEQLKSKMEHKLIKRILDFKRDEQVEKYIIEDSYINGIRKKWIEKFKDIDIYKKSKLARFLIFMAFYNSLFDEKSKKLTPSKQHFLRLQEWKSDDYRDVEHIVPQFHKSIGQIGNLILLPPRINQWAGTKKFIEKRKIYANCLNDDDSDDEYPYLRILKEVLSYDKEGLAEDGHFSEDAIDKRGERLGHVIFENLYKWLKSKKSSQKQLTLD